MSSTARTTRRRRKGWGRALCTRRVLQLIVIGQRWADHEQVSWTVRQVHRADHQVLLQSGAAGPFRYVAFHELGREYLLIDRGAGR